MYIIIILTFQISFSLNFFSKKKDIYTHIYIIRYPRVRDVTSVVSNIKPLSNKFPNLK